jgi:ATP-binding cassette subfamily C protein
VHDQPDDTPAVKRVDRLSWAEIRRLALHHKKSLWIANGVAVLATLCSVPIPLLLPLLVDEVLLGHGDAALKIMNLALPEVWQKAAGYIGLMLVVTLALRCAALLFNVVQARLFAALAKDIVYRIRIRLIERLKCISLAEYESLGSGTVTTHLVTDLDTLDKFVGETLSRFLVAMLTLCGNPGVDALATGAADPVVQPAGDLRHGATGQAGQAPEETRERQHLALHPGVDRNPGRDPGSACR